MRTCQKRAAWYYQRAEQLIITCLRKWGTKQSPAKIARRAKLPQTVVLHVLGKRLQRAERKVVRPAMRIND